MPIARSLSAYPQSAGNLAVVAIVDSSQPEFAFQFESAFGALTHFGIPFRVLDLAHAPVTAASLGECRAAVVFQEHVGPRLRGASTAALLRAVDGGMGLVSFDADVAQHDGELLAAAGLAGAGRAGEVVTGGTQTLGVVRSDHPITWWQEGAAAKALKAPLPTNTSAAPDPAPSAAKKAAVQKRVDAVVKLVRKHGTLRAGLARQLKGTKLSAADLPRSLRKDKTLRPFMGKPLSKLFGTALAKGDKQLIAVLQGQIALP
jgi:hypothetical protein